MFHGNNYIQLPTPQEALAYLADHQMAALQQLAREHITADHLRSRASFPLNCFGAMGTPSPSQVAEGKVDIWVYAARVQLHLQDSIGDAEEIVLEHDRLIAAGWENDFPAHAVAYQIDWYLT